MREDTKKVLCELEERATKELKKLLDGKPDFSPTEWQSAGAVVDVIKDVEKSIKDTLTASAMEEEYGGWDEMGESKRGHLTNYYPMGDVSFAGNRRGGVRTNNRYMGGSSYTGSSYAGEMDSAISNLHNLMNNAKSDSERMMYQRFIDEAERERYGR